MKTKNDVLELFRNAVRDAVSGEFAGPNALQPLQAAIPMMPDPEAALAVYRSETAPEQAELELHLEGSSITDHSTSALEFSTFVGAFSQAVKSLAQSIGHVRSVEPPRIKALVPGSIRVTLCAPDERKPKDHVEGGADAPLEGTAVPTPQTKAMNEIVRLFNEASAPGTSEVELSSFKTQKARIELKKALQVVQTADWAVEGTVIRRHSAPKAVRLTPAGAAQLRVALDSSDVEVETHIVQGRLDGYKHSDGRIYFVPDHGPRFSFFAPDEDVYAAAIRLSADVENHVKATFKVRFSVTADGTRGRGVERTLVKLRSFPEQPAA